MEKLVERDDPLDYEPGEFKVAGEGARPSEWLTRRLWLPDAELLEEAEVEALQVGEGSIQRRCSVLAGVLGEERIQLGAAGGVRGVERAALYAESEGLLCQGASGLRCGPRERADVADLLVNLWPDAVEEVAECLLAPLAPAARRHPWTPPGCDS
jgi:hypothetical protein